MKVGLTVDYKINESFIRAAKISKIHDSGKCDLMVFAHPDDYPEFSQAECVAGNGVRREIAEGTGPNTFSVPVNPEVEKLKAKIKELESKKK